MTANPAKRPTAKRTMRSGTTVTIERVEDLDNDATMIWEIRGASNVTIRIRDDLITAEGREVLAELLTAMLDAHFRPAEPLRLV